MELKIRKLSGKALLFAVLLFLLAAAMVLLAVRAQSRSLKTAYVELQGSAGTIRFVERTTPSELYQTWRQACDDHLGAIGQADRASGNNVVIVNEDTFVDYGAAEAEATSDADPYVEGEIVYFEGWLLACYVSQSGDILTLAACSDGEDSPLVLSMEDFAAEGRAAPPQISGTIEDEMEEDAFLGCIMACMTALLSEEAEPAAAELLFTESGMSSLRRLGRSVAADQSCEAEILLCDVGSSDQNEMLADRIFLRCRIAVEEKTMVLDLLLKLNGDLMVYDVDLI